MARLREQVKLARRYFEEFVEHRRRGESRYAVERLAQLTIQTLLDTGAMLAVYLKLSKPDTYRGLARLLARELRLDVPKCRFLEQLAGFRNLLVHGYAEIDLELEEKAFEEMEETLPKILEALESFVTESGTDPSNRGVGESLSEVFRKHGVRFAFLFGSRARKGYGRDYDIAVSLDVESALDLGGLLVDVAEALEVSEDFVDLVHLDTAPSAIVYTVLQEGKLIYGDLEEAYSYLYRKYLEVLDINSFKQEQP